MFNKYKLTSFCLFALVLVVLAILLMNQPTHVSAQSPTATPDLLCKTEWAAYDDAVIKKNINWIEDKRAELIICVVNASRNQASEVDGAPTTLPASQQIGRYLFMNWKHMGTVDKATADRQPVQIAMATNFNNIAFATYLHSEWVVYDGYFTPQHDGGAPLIAYLKDKTVHVAVYFEKSLSVLDVYHLPADGSHVTNFEPASLTFTVAKTAQVNNNGCFVGMLGQVQNTLCPFTQVDGSISYIPYQ